MIFRIRKYFFQKKLKKKEKKMWDTSTLRLNKTMEGFVSKGTGNYFKGKASF